MMAGINEYPLEYRRVIYKRIEAATGESAEKIKKAYFKKLEKILERGVIKDREEYELVHSRIDELVHNGTRIPERYRRAERQYPSHH